MLDAGSNFGSNSKILIKLISGVKLGSDFVIKL